MVSRVKQTDGSGFVATDTTAVVSSERDTARLATEQLVSHIIELAVEYPACRAALSAPDRDGLTPLHCAGNENI